MRVSYAITWQEAEAEPRSGKLELKPRALGFEGSNGKGSAAEEVPYEDLSAVRIARASGDRLSGRPTLVLERRTGGPIRIASVAQPGIISELVEHLAALHLGEENPVSRAVVVVLPLKEEARDQAAALLEQGPPFDPEEAGLERHQVFLTDHEAVFAFEAVSAAALDGLVSDTTLWAAAAAWKELVAGPPRLAQDVYSWVRQQPTDVSFAATPGPGDSDGGDIFAP